MKLGFTLLEIIFVLLISSLITVSLYQTFLQISKSVNSMVRVIEADGPLIPFYNQLEKDVTSIFAPEGTLKEFGQRYLKKESKDKKEKEEPKKEQQKIIENIFYVNMRDDGGIIWSFITTNGILRLEKDGSLMPQPYVNRAYYLLERDPDNQELFRLIYRTNYSNLNLSEIEKNDFYPSYVIMQNIKSFSLEFTVFESVQNNKKTKDSTPKVPKKNQLREWHEKEIFEKYKTLVPAFVKVSGAYTDLTNKIEYPFSFEFKVYAYKEYDAEAEKKIPAKEQLQESTEKSKVIFDKLTQFVEKKLVNLNPNNK